MDFIALYRKNAAVSSSLSRSLRICYEKCDLWGGENMGEGEGILDLEDLLHYDSDGLPSDR